MRILIILTLALFVSACNVPTYGQRCQGFGFTPGTDAYAGCLLSLHQQSEAETNANNNMLYGAYLNGYYNQRR